MENHLVSIITPMFNAARFVEQTVYSIIHQTYPYWELLIIDDGSTDDGSQIVSSFLHSDTRIRYIYQQNSGTASARNNGIRHANGRYIAFLDADDLWSPTFLEEQLNFLQSNHCQLVCCAFKRIDEDNLEILRPYIPPKIITRNDLLKTCAIGCLTALYDTQPYGKIYQREDREIREDLVLWLDILNLCKKAYGNPKVLASYRIVNISQSRPRFKVIIPQYNVYRKIEHLNIFQSLYYLIHWAIRGFFKYRQ